MNNFNTPEWRQARDQKLLEWTGDQAATDMILLIGHYIDILTSLHDNEEATQPVDLEALYQIPFISLSVNPFWIIYQKQLAPLLWVQHNAWLSAGKIEEGAAVADCETPQTSPLAFSFAYRFYFVELILFVIYLLRGNEYVRQVDSDVRALFMDQTLHEYGQDLKEKRKDTQAE